jgi:transcriptional regulator with XRE-family HTH domain
MGQAIGKSEATVSRIERGKQALGVDDLTVIAELLGLAPGDLLPQSGADDTIHREARLLVRALIEAYRQELRRTRTAADDVLQRFEDQMQRLLPPDGQGIVSDPETPPTRAYRRGISEPAYYSLEPAFA